MKKLFILLMVIICVDTAAQEFTLKPKGKISGTTVILQNLFSDLEIEGTTSGEIKIEADDYEGIPEKATGLRPLSARGPDNTGIGLNINQMGNTIMISGTSRHADDTDYRFILPTDLMLKIEYDSFKAGDISVRGMSSDIEVRTQVGDIEFVEVTGPVVASTLSSDIKVIFSELNQSSPTSLTSVSGDIDITLPESSKGTFTMSTVSGEIYTDLNFELGENGKLNRIIRGMSANANLNGGGVQVTVRSVSGDIFIRKGD